MKFENKQSINPPSCCDVREKAEVLRAAPEVAECKLGHDGGDHNKTRGGPSSTHGARKPGLLPIHESEIYTIHRIDTTKVGCHLVGRLDLYSGCEKVKTGRVDENFGLACFGTFRFCDFSGRNCQTCCLSKNMTF